MTASDLAGRDVAVAATPAPPARPRLHLIRWLVLATLVCSATFVWGAMSSEGSAALDLPTGDQQAMLAEHGPPPLWAVVEAIDGDPTSARYEQWFYPEAGVIAAFLDGSLDGEMEVTWTNEEATTVSSPVSPVHLDASMTPEDVDALVGTPAVELEALQTDLGVVYSRGYPDAHLVVQFLHDRVYTAQTP